MKPLRILLTTIALSVCSLALAQPQRDSVKVYFQQGKSEFDPLFESNFRRLSDFTNKAKAVQRDSLVLLDRLVVLATASPEGTREVNERLAYERAQNIADYLHKTLRFDENALEVSFKEMDWDLFESLVRADDKIPAQAALLEAMASRKLEDLKVPRWQKTWDYLLKNVFPEMRKTLVVFEYRTAEQLAAAEPEPEEPVVEPVVEPAPRRPVVTPPPLPDDGEDFDLDLEEEEEHSWSMYIKTNLAALALLDANLAVEFEMGRHFSFSLPVYYSAADWFSVKNKFRVFGTQPELRFWFRDDFSGPFLAAHGTFGWYNVAVASSTYRYQDLDAHAPTYGAGANVGWKFRLDRYRADRWGLELSLGGGWLHLNYDMFYNVENGRYSSSAVKDYYGPDHAAVTLTYRIGK